MDPLSIAMRSANEGATWLHIVGRGDTPDLVQHIVQVTESRNVQVQYASRLRTLADVEVVLSWGVARVILDPTSMQEPDMVREAVQRFGASRIVVEILARNGMVATENGLEKDESALDLAQQLKTLGVEHIVYNEVGYDGTHQRIPIAKVGELAQKSGLKVIVSGDVRSLEALRQVRWVEPYGIEGVIVDLALHEGRFSLQEALATVGSK
jgi:phosphoribosylformimino-5-aminoimidazole carboxamide ribotide isomerase